MSTATTVELAVAGSARGIRQLAEVVAERQPDAVLRVLADDGTLSVVAATPFDVLVLHSVAAPGVAAFDVVVEAATLAATAAASSGEDMASLRLPAPLDPLRWTWPMPPRTGWEPIPGGVRVGDLRAARARAVAAFRAAAESMPADQRTSAALERLAAHQWDDDVVLGVSVRMAHAAAAHGLLPGTAADETPADDPVLPVLARGAWRRLDAPGGSVVQRRGGLTLRG